MKKLPKLIVILGATATGKTKLAVDLARVLNGEIISADSRQVYTGMDIGTGKDLEAYGQGKNRLKYHLIDVVAPSTQFDLKSYQKAAYGAIDSVIKAKKVPILVGGSGLYLQAVVDGYTLSDVGAAPVFNEDLSLDQIKAKLGSAFVDKLNPSEQKNKRRLLRYLDIIEKSKSLHESLHKESKPRYASLVIGLEVSIDTIRKNIKKRLDDRFKEGMIEEVQRLHAEGLSYKKLESFGLEYKYIVWFLQKKLSREEMEKQLALASGQFAKRQLTWFRRWEKQGREIVWIKSKDKTKALALIHNFLK